MKVLTLLAASLFALSTGACIDAPTTDGTAELDTDSTEPADSEVSDVERIAVNALTPAQLNAANIPSTMITQAWVDSMAPYADGREVLKHVIDCALDSTQSFSSTVGITTYTFTGGIGLAPSWTTGALNTTAQRWVSGCVLSRVNQFGTKVTISIRGNTTPLALAGTEGTDYQIQEGAFFGSVFSGTFYAAACNGVDQNNNDSYGDLPLRECAEAGTLPYTNCSGIRYAGLCADVCSGSAGNWTSCLAPNNTTYNQVVTSYLKGVPQ